MLIGISSLLTPDVLYALAAMGHGDRVAIVDANFPAERIARRLNRLPAIPVPPVLDAILKLLPLDGFVDDPAVSIQQVGDPDAVPEAVADIDATLRAHGHAASRRIERYAFYEETAHCFAVIQTGEGRPYGNVILAKGVIFADHPG
ncbi:ribose ABC transporter [Gluconacetobacter diazotrophicus]|uniref:Ribose ABC transporter n=1 Tax=Gluconacetobacter diazotrophicus TaxID=33996 RepID=A0A7W4NNZ0_GLUDI|nr:RbsD/FucU domain-containing protein [Gluconacetobacter diazotrophicus]MBB2157830.1 ribose ABC transporter [Gluconacetobacter diazotrophicus]